MASKQKKSAAKPEGSEYPRKGVQCEDGKTGEERGRNYATLATSPELAAYRVINGVERNSGIDKHLDVPTLIETLREQAKAVNLNDLSKAEAMLMNQATALQSLFVRLTEKAFSVGLLPQFEAFMRMALRAQNQCRTTLETLATIKNPPIVYARQANVTTGPQQINNGITTPSRVGKIENEQTQLLRADHGEWMDTGTAGATIGSDPAMATLEEIYRADLGKG